MKVIFIADVPNVARAGQTKEVANGYARNFLFPRKLAVLANSQAAANVEVHLKKIAKQRAIEEAEMSELAKKINGVEITLKAKVGEKDKLYGSITGADIAEALSKEISREIDKKRVDLAEPIRLVGVHDVTVRFTHDITAVIVVTVMSDAEGAEKPVRAVAAVAAVAAPATEVKEEKKEKAEKKEKKPKKEKAPKEPKEETPAVEEKPEKPAKEKKAKAEKAEKPAKEEKKEKKSKAKKAEAVEDKKEKAQGE